MALENIRVAETDYYARVFYKAATMDDYYGCIDALRPVLCEREWLETTTGFYLFRYPCRADRPATLRLTYFLRSKEADNLAREKSDIEHFRIWRRASPVRDKLNEARRDELEFPVRRFLCVGTQIALDVLEANREEAQQLFRLIHHRQCWEDMKDEFLDRLEVHSGVFGSLPSNVRKQFVHFLESNTCRHNFAGAVIEDRLF